MTAQAASKEVASAREDVGRHYSQLLDRFGPTPLAVGWTCIPTQELRFVQLAKLFADASDFSVNDIGCGYGALLAYVRRRHRKARVDYLGIDVSQAMVDEATRKWKKAAGARFVIAEGIYRTADFCVASGTFNVKLGHGLAAWENLVSQTLADMYSRCMRGVAVNFLSQDARLDEVAEHYRCAPDRWIEQGQRLGARVEVLEDYGMPEFTLLLRRH